MRDNKVFFAYVATVTTMIFACMTGPWQKMALNYGVPTEAIVFLKSFLSFLLLLPFYARQENRRDMKRILSTRSIIGVLVLASVAKCFNSVFWVEALKGTSVFVVTIIAQLHPLATALGAYLFLGEKTPFSAVCGMLICILGLVTVGIIDAQDASGNRLMGLVYAALSTTLFSVYMLINRGVHQKGTFCLPNLLIIQFGTMSVITLIMGIAKGVNFGPYPLQAYVPLLMLALFASLLAQFCNVFSLRYIPASTQSTLCLLEPMVAAILAFLMLGEIPTLGTVIGSLIVMAGMAWYFYALHRNRKKLAPAPSVAHSSDQQPQE